MKSTPTPILMIRTATLIVGLIISVSLWPIHAAMADSEALEKILSGLGNQLHDGSITKVHVLIRPYNGESPITVDSANLRVNAHFECDVSLTAEQIRELIQAVTQTKIRVPSKNPDMHWAVDFLGRDGKVLRDLYFGREASDGAVAAIIGGETVTLNSAIVRWLDKTFPGETVVNNPFVQATDGQCRNEFLRRYHRL